MTMPVDLFLVRHGESERNLANRAAYAGDLSYFAREFIERPTSLARLTPRGIEQAVAAGDWLRTYAGLMPRTDHYYCSSYVRAAETAALLGLPGAKWRRLNRLCERSAGDWEHVPAPERKKLLVAYPVKHYELDPYNWPPPNGERLADVEDRLTLFLDTLHRGDPSRRAVVVGHGEVLLVFRVMLERMTDEEFKRVHGSKDAYDRIQNCLIIQYTRRVPNARETTPYYNWMRMVCPWDTSLSSNDWKPIRRAEFSNDELMRLVEAHPTMLKEAP